MKETWCEVSWLETLKWTLGRQASMWHTELLRGRTSAVLHSLLLSWLQAERTAIREVSAWEEPRIFKVNQPPSGCLLHFSLWWLDPCLQESWVYDPWELTGDIKACSFPVKFYCLVVTFTALGLLASLWKWHLLTSLGYTYRKLSICGIKGDWVGPDVTLRAICKPSAAAVPHAVQLRMSSLGI